MGNLSFCDENQSVLSAIKMGEMFPGGQVVKEFAVKNNLANNKQYNTTLSFFPGLQNDEFNNITGTPIASIDIIGMNNSGELQTTAVAKEDSDATCSLLTTYSEKVFKYNTSSQVWSDITDDAIKQLCNTNEVLYEGHDFITYNRYYDLGTAGSYGSVSRKAYNGSAWADISGVTSYSDGTSALTTSGNLALGDIDDWGWSKVAPENATGTYIKKAYWLQTSVTTVVTQAQANSLYWNHAYDLPYSCIASTPAYYTYSASTYTATSADAEYLNYGFIAFKTDPLPASNHLLKFEGDYKNPQPGVYQVDYAVSGALITATITKPNLSTVAVAIATGTSQLNIIAGCQVSSSQTITNGNQALVTFSDAVKWAHNRTVSGSFVNKDLNLGTINEDSLVSFYSGIMVPVSEDNSENTHYIKPFAYASLEA